VHVDEPWRDVAICGIDDGGCHRVRESTDSDDTIAANRDVGAVPRVAAAIENASVADQDVIGSR
jgi:hypothetical protein